MRSLIIVLLIFLNGWSAYGQISPASKRQDTRTFYSRYSEDLTLQLKAVGITFDDGKEYLDDDLKKKIECFFDNTSDMEYSSIGQHELRIVKRDDIYYVIRVDGLFEELLKLCD
ncbi:MAG: hypothetical protein M9887_07275 [Chitinophagales bacterium]|nr:hypothetical protein [Chitinophagales bacterium]